MRVDLVTYPFYAGFNVRQPDFCVFYLVLAGSNALKHFLREVTMKLSKDMTLGEFYDLLGVELSEAEEFKLLARDGDIMCQASSPTEAIQYMLDSQTPFCYLDLNGLDFGKRHLVNQDFSDCCAEGANFSGANLTGANFRGAELEGADFSGAKLVDTKFEGADLRDANFEGANLSGVDFAKAQLRGAKF